MKFFIYSFLFSVLFSLYARLHVCVNYFINQSYYAQVLCENKSVKNSCCKGKCAMSKELRGLDKKEESQSRKTNSPVLKLSKAEEMANNNLLLTIQPGILSLISTACIANTQSGTTKVILRPPILSA